MTRGSSANLGFVPEPLAQLPWKVILLVLAIGCFDLLVLYSAAGGHIRPWALSQGVRFFVLLGGAMALSRVRESTWSSISLPVYGASKSWARSPAAASAGSNSASSGCSRPS